MTNESEIKVEERNSGQIGEWLSNNGFENTPLQEDHLGIVVIKITPNILLPIVEALKNNFNYLKVLVKSSEPLLEIDQILLIVMDLMPLIVFLRLNIYH